MPLRPKNPCDRPATAVSKIRCSPGRNAKSPARSPKTRTDCRRADGKQDQKKTTGTRHRGIWDSCRVPGRASAAKASPPLPADGIQPVGGQSPSPTTSTWCPTRCPPQRVSRYPIAVNAAICSFLAAAVALVFAQTAGHGFVDYDDDAYVYGNFHVGQGLTLAGIERAFTGAMPAIGIR